MSVDVAADGCDFAVNFEATWQDRHSLLQMSFVHHSRVFVFCAIGAQARSLFTACMMKEERVPFTPGMRNKAFMAKSLNVCRSGAKTWTRKSMSPVTA